MVAEILCRNKKLYHGSTVIVRKPDIFYGEVGKDFGQGFYTTTDRRQAIQFAKLKGKLYFYDIAYVSMFNFSNFDGLRVYEFPTTNADWFNCIIGNRFLEYDYLAKPWESYDVLIGKVADDNTSAVLSAYMGHAYGPIGSLASIEKAIDELRPENLNNQICFRTNKALKKIKFLREEVVAVWQ